MMRTGQLYFVYIIFLCLCGAAHGQDKPSLVPGLSPLTLQRGQTEINCFNNLHFFNSMTVSPGASATDDYSSFETSVQVTYGVTSQFNFGADYAYARIENIRSSVYGKAEIIYWSAAVSGRVRWSPLRPSYERRYDLTFQHFVSFPIYGSLQGTRVSQLRNRYSQEPSFVNQAILMSKVSEKFVILAQIELAVLGRMSDQASRPLILPVTFFLSHAFTTRWMVFASLSYVARCENVSWDHQERYYRTASVFRGGGGIQWNLSSRLVFNASALFPVSTSGISADYLKYRTLNISARCKFN